ncbi:leucine-rich repeat domain-containing protein [Brevibacillus sp. SYSU BS000544]|uniref:leucine-rich repeat domain-containing protein n=1 Tax=Brevibacillus sp. SYSU BS000544 TaxID=3416443 RepID=UPI003CE4ACCA
MRKARKAVWLCSLIAFFLSFLFIQDVNILYAKGNVPEIEWVNQDGEEENSYEWVMHAEQTRDGGYILLREYNVSLSIVKLTKNGKKEWEKRFTYEIPQNPFVKKMRPSFIRETRDGGYIVCGSIDNGLYDMYLLKVTNKGERVWEKAYGSEKNDFAFFVNETIDGGFIFGGFGGLIKIDKQGKQQWERNNEDYLVTQYAKQRSDGHYIVFTDHFIELDSEGKELSKKALDIGRVKDTDDGGFLIVGANRSLYKIDDSANVLWKTQMSNNEPSGKEVLFKITGTNDGGGAAIFGSEEQDLIYLEKYNGNGEYEWKMTLDSEDIFGDDEIEGIPEIEAFQQTMDEGFVFAGKVESRRTGYDAFVVKTVPNKVRNMTKLAIYPNKLGEYLDKPVQLKLTATYDDGTKDDVTDAADWTSSDPYVAFIDNKGLLTIIGREGQTDITASYRGETAKAHVSLATSVDIPDLNLEKLIRKTLGREEGLPLTKQDMLNLTEIEGSRKGIKSLEGLQYAYNLQRIILPINEVSDLTPLQKLQKLESLSLYDNQVTSMKALQNLKNLEDLILEGNKISDIAPVKKLKNLKGLNLSRNNIKDFSSIKGLNKLESLHLDENKLTDISFLSGLKKLRYVYLENNQLTDVTVLSKLPELDTIWLNDNQIYDLSPLYSLKNLLNLSVEENYINVAEGSKDREFIRKITGSVSGIPATKTLDDLLLDKSEISLAMDESATIKINAKMNGKTIDVLNNVVGVSNNEKVARFKDGKIVALEPGSATITFTYNEKKVALEVTVTSK